MDRKKNTDKYIDVYAHRGQITDIQTNVKKKKCIQRN